MAGKVNVRFPDELQRHINHMTTGAGLYENTSEYLRDLVRRDYLRSEELKETRIIEDILPQLEAPESEFSTLDLAKIKAMAKAKYDS